MDNVRIASAGIWHSHAKDFANRLENIPYGKLEAVWDADPEKAKAWAAEKGVRCFTDYEELIHDPDIDGIMVTCETVNHIDLLIKAAQAGKNVYVEKALCASAEDAMRLQKVVHGCEDKFGIRFVMSDPIQNPIVLYAKKLMDEGKFGTILSLRSRNGHSLAYEGPEEARQYVSPSQSGGGALLDMGHHSVHTVNFLLGKPESAVGMFNNVSPISKECGGEDFHSVMFRYPNGTVAIAEGGLVMTRQAGGLEIVGDQGYLLSTGFGEARCCFRGEEPYTINKDELPEAWIKPQNYWIKCIHDGVPCDRHGIDEAVELVEMIDAAYRSKNGTVVKL